MQQCLRKVAVIAMPLVVLGATSARSQDRVGAHFGFAFPLGLLQVGKDATLFAELDVPIRFKEDGQGNGYTSIGLAVVVGVGF